MMKGLLIGFTVGGVGPIDVLCIHKTMLHGRIVGFMTGLGASIGEVIYGLVAAFGLFMTIDSLAESFFLIQWLGGVLLLMIGFKMLISKTKETLDHKHKDIVQHKHLFKNFVTTLFLTIASPTTIFTYIALFTALDFYVDNLLAVNISSMLVFLFSIFAGSLCWWLALIEGTCFFTKRCTKPPLRFVSICGGIICCAFGALALLSLL